MNKLNWSNPSENVPDDGARIIVESKAGFGIVTFHSWNFKENKNKIWWIDSPVFRYAYLPKEDDDEFWSSGNDNLENVYSLVVGNNSNSSILNMNNISLLKPHQEVNEYTINKYHILNYGYDSNRYISLKEYERSLKDKIFEIEKDLQYAKEKLHKFQNSFSKNCVNC